MITLVMTTLNTTAAGNSLWVLPNDAVVALVGDQGGALQVLLL